ncbi:hypothetical protein BH09GEM1_BH09GEM1_05050 [soil metagenome]
MTVSQWLDSRTPRPPRALTDRLDASLAGLAIASRENTAETLLRASEAIIAELLERDGTTRDSALDLLAADALMTYAMEAAAEDIRSLDARATGAMSRVSSIAQAASSSP